VDRGQRKEMLNHKSQIANLKQYQPREIISYITGSNTNVLNSKQFRSLGFGILNLFGAWNLVLGILDLFAICYHSCNSQLKKFSSLLVTHYSSLLSLFAVRYSFIAHYLLLSPPVSILERSN